MIKNYTFYLTDAFTTDCFKGNPAGVVIHQEPLTAETMQKVAAELKQSETIFIEKIDTFEYKVRYFTPVEEVDLCGHATIAGFYTKAKQGYFDPLLMGQRELTLHTKAGKIKVYIEYKENTPYLVTMEQPAAQFLGECTDREAMAEILALPREALTFNGKEVPLEYVSTGIKDVMVPVSSKAHLWAIDPDFEKMEEFSRKEDFYSYHVYYYDEKENLIYQRNFCPRLGIDEESATGTSTGALLSYLRKHALIRGREIHGIQGENMGRRSDIFAKFETTHGEEKLLVGGSAVILIEGVMNLI